MSTYRDAPPVAAEPARAEPVWIAPQPWSRLMMRLATSPIYAIKRRARQALRDTPDPGVVHAVIRSLVDGTTEQWIEYYLNTTASHADNWPFYREHRQACEALSGTSAVDALVHVVGTGSPCDRITASLCLVHTRGAGAVEPLFARIEELVAAPIGAYQVDRLNNAETIAHTAALVALGAQIPVAALERWLGGLHLGASDAWYRLLVAKGSDEATGALCRLLCRSRSRQAEGALEALVKEKGPRVLEPLLGEREYYPLQFAFRYLLPVFTRDDADKLVELSAHPIEDIALQAARRAYELAPERGFEAGARALERATRSDVIASAAELLARVGDPRALPLVEAARKWPGLGAYVHQPLPPELAGQPAFEIFEGPRAEAVGASAHTEAVEKFDRALAALRKGQPTH